MKYIYIILMLFLYSCEGDKNIPAEKYHEGEALGTTYHIKFFSDKEFAVEKGIDSVFYVINKSMSTYLPTSDISKLNRGDSTVVVDEMFQEVFESSQQIYHDSQGYFDPTVGNLVNAYGFGSEKEQLNLSPQTIDSLMQYVGLDKISIDKNGKVEKESPQVYIEFNAIAKGYSIDRLAMLLENYGVENYLVEVGGELRARGRNLSSEKDWRVGIDDPRQSSEERKLSHILRLKDKSMATSGNYRKFKYDSVSGQTYVHTINPKTGSTEKSSILSATVLAENCMLADGYATAFMAMGLERTKENISAIEGIEALLMYDDNGELKTFQTPGFEKYLVEKD